MKNILKRIKNSKIFKKIIAIFGVIVILVSILVIPASAEDTVSSDIDDLTGTAWKIQGFDTFDIVARFMVTGYFSFQNPSYAYDLKYILCGYGSYTSSSSVVTGTTVHPNSSYFIGSSYSVQHIDVDSTFPRTVYVYFSGGLSVKSSQLINFVTSNGIQIDYYPPSEPSEPEDEPEVNYPSDEDNSSSYTIEKGYYYSPNDPVIPSVSLSASLPFRASSGSSSGYSDYTSMSVFSASTLTDSNVSYDETIVSSSTSWLDFGSRLIYVTKNTSVPSAFYSWYSSQFISVSGSSSGSYNEGYRTGFTDGKSEGYSQGYKNGLSVGEFSGYDEGYGVGFQAGLGSSDSAALGQNLLGDTLSAPLKALNQFVIYQAPSGFNVTLGGVVGAAISLTLFIAFLKIFAGG